MNDTDAQIAKATQYCTYCPKLCRFTCPVAQAEHRETVTPWGLMRLLEMTRTDDFPRDEETVSLFFHCTGCLRCQTWCNHDNDVPMAMWDARARAWRDGETPEEIVAYTMALRHEHSLPGSKAQKSLALSAFDPDSDIGFFATCHASADPEELARRGRLLERLLGQRVRLLSLGSPGAPSCCGAPLAAAGDCQGAHQWLGEVARSCDGLAVVLTDCEEMVSMVRSPERWGLEIPDTLGAARHLLELLDEVLVHNPPPSVLEPQGALLFQGCHATRHLGWSETLKRVASRLFAQTPALFFEHDDQSECCGARGLYPVIDPQGASACATHIASTMIQQHGEGMVCSSSACASHLRRKGDEDVSIIDVIEAACMAYEVD